MGKNRKTTSGTKACAAKDLVDMVVPEPIRTVLKSKKRGGAPKGNAFKTGFHMAQSKELRRRIRTFRHRVDAVLAVFKDAPRPHRAEKSAD